MQAILFVPGHREDWFDSAMRSGADKVVFDLEDGVPENAKDIARKNVAAFMPHTGTNTAVRIESETHTWFVGEVWIPKCTKARRNGRWVPIIESARGLRFAPYLAEYGATALQFGMEDLRAEIGRRTLASEMEHHMAMSVSLAAAAAGIPAYGSPCLDPHDNSLVQQRAQWYWSLGFAGMAAIHPAQVPVIRSVGYSQDDRDWSKQIGETEGAYLQDGHLCGPPTRKLAQKILDAA